MSATKRITVDLQADLAEAMRRSVEGGEYGSDSDIVDDALRDWAHARSGEGNDLERLRRLIEEGDASGPSIPAEEVYAELRVRIAEPIPRGLYRSPTHPRPGAMRKRSQTTLPRTTRSAR